MLRTGATGSNTTIMLTWNKEEEMWHRTHVTQRLSKSTKWATESILRWQKSKWSSSPMSTALKMAVWTSQDLWKLPWWWGLQPAPSCSHRPWFSATFFSSWARCRPCSRSPTSLKPEVVRDQGSHLFSWFLAPACDPRLSPHPTFQLSSSPSSPASWQFQCQTQRRFFQLPQSHRVQTFWKIPGAVCFSLHRRALFSVEPTPLVFPTLGSYLFSQSFYN